LIDPCPLCNNNNNNDTNRVEGRGGGFWGTSRDKSQPFEVVEVEASPESQDAVLAHRLWALSEELAAPFLGPLGQSGEEEEQKDKGKGKAGRGL